MPLLIRVLTNCLAFQRGFLPFVAVQFMLSIYDVFLLRCKRLLFYLLAFALSQNHSSFHFSLFSRLSQKSYTTLEKRNGHKFQNLNTCPSFLRSRTNRECHILLYVANDFSTNLFFTQQVIICTFQFSAYHNSFMHFSCVFITIHSQINLSIYIYLSHMYSFLFCAQLKDVFRFMPCYAFFVFISSLSFLLSQVVCHRNSLAICDAARCPSKSKSNEQVFTFHIKVSATDNN